MIKLNSLGTIQTLVNIHKLNLKMIISMRILNLNQIEDRRILITEVAYRTNLKLSKGECIKTSSFQIFLKF